MYFLRWTHDAEQDVRRNFSGHMQAWFDTKEEAWEDYQENLEQGRHLESEPKQDPVNGMWNSDPEWGLSGYGFNDTKSFQDALKQIKEIAWHHEDNNGQELVVFYSDNFQIGSGFDGEDLFRNAKIICSIDKNTKYKEFLLALKQHQLSEVRHLIRKLINL